VSQIPFSWVDDQVYSVQDSFTDFTYIEAVRGVVTGNYVGLVKVVDDEPLPIISALSSNVTAMEGRSLQWTLNLSSPTDGTSISFVMIAPTNGTELTTNDVAPSWLASINIFSRPTIPVPLSSLGSIIEVSFDYGVTLASLVIPLTRDGQSEGNELIVLELVSSFDFSAPVQPLTLIGNVVAHA
jgi:hypothetical protein